MQTTPHKSSLVQLQVLRQATLQAERKGRPMAVPSLLRTLGIEDSYQGPPSGKRKGDLQAVQARLTQLRRERRRREAGAGALVSTIVGLGLGLGFGAAGSALLLITATFGAVFFIPCWLLAKLAGETNEETLEEKRLQEDVKRRKFLAEHGVDLSGLKSPTNKDALQRGLGHLLAISEQLPEPGSPRAENAAEAAIEAFGRIFRIAQALEALESDPRLADLGARYRELRDLEVQIARTKRPMLAQSLREHRQALRREVDDLETLHADAQELRKERDLLVRSLGTISEQLDRLGAEPQRSGRAERVRDRLEEATLSLTELIEAQEPTGRRARP